MTRERSTRREQSTKDGEEAYEPDVTIATILEAGVGHTARNPIRIRTMAGSLAYV